MVWQQRAGKPRSSAARSVLKRLSGWMARQMRLMRGARKPSDTFTGTPKWASTSTWILITLSRSASARPSGWWMRSPSMRSPFSRRRSARSTSCVSRSIPTISTWMSSSPVPLMMRESLYGFHVRSWSKYSFSLPSSFLYRSSYFLNVFSICFRLRGSASMPISTAFLNSVFSFMLKKWK